MEQNNIVSNVSVDNWDNMPALNPNSGMKSEIILSVISILIVLAIILLLRKLIKKHAEKQGKEEKHPFRIICKWYYIIVAIGYTFYLWYGKENYNDLWSSAFLLGIPIGIALAVHGDGWKETLMYVFSASLCSALVLHFGKTFESFKNNYELIVKIVGSIAFVISAIRMFGSKGEFIKKSSLIQSNTYSGSDYSNSYNNNSSNPFEGGNFTKKRNYSGGYDYIDSKTGKVIAKGKISLSGEETIVDEHGNTVLKEKKGIFSSTYKDANGNTVYTKDTDIFGDNQIKDNNGNVKYEDDFLDRWLWGESNYKKK